MENSRYNEAPYLENPTHEQATRSPYPSCPSNLPTASNERIVYVERRKRRRKCCCCFPLVPGVYILVILNLITALFTLVVGGLGFATGQATGLFVFLALYGVASFIVLLIGLIGLNKWDPKLYAAAPAYMIFSVIANLVSSIFAFTIAKPQAYAKYRNEFSPLEPTDKNHIQATALAMSVACNSAFGFFFGIYYSYVMVRLYKVMKKEPKHQH